MFKLFLKCYLKIILEDVKWNYNKMSSHMQKTLIHVTINKRPITERLITKEWKLHAWANTQYKHKKEFEVR